MVVRGDKIHKHVKDSSSSELKILRELCSLKRRSENVLYPDYLQSIGLGVVIVMPREIPLQSVLSYSERWSFDLVSGLMFLHRRHIAHMDIKPSNLVCTRDSVLKIIDFNLAEYEVNLNTTKLKCRGTAGWMAPGWYYLFTRLTSALICIRSRTGHLIQPNFG